MQKEKRLLKRVVSIFIEPYLAEYISNKYAKDNITGGVKIPPTSDLYFCVWENMSKPRSNSIHQEGNLKIHLPFRRGGSELGLPWKDPAYFNYLSKSAVREIEAHVRRVFNFELHRVLLENEEHGRPKLNIEVINDFISSYELKSISTDALLKNFYRYRNKVRHKKARKYIKS